MVQLEKEFDDISSATDDILNDVLVGTRNSVGNQLATITNCENYNKSITGSAVTHRYG